MPANPLSGPPPPFSQPPAATQARLPAATPRPEPRSPAGPGTPARGGLVFVIIGLSVVIAILVIVLLWALLARG
ncbi:MAG: hypothetical protein R3B70_28130 [Polyangiaceae bacterium]